MKVFVQVPLPSDEAITFVGVYVLRWGTTDQPTVGFREATADELADALITAVKTDSLDVYEE